MIESLVIVLVSDNWRHCLNIKHGVYKCFCFPVNYFYFHQAINYQYWSMHFYPVE